MEKIPPPKCINASAPAARKVAIQTDTDLIVVKDGKLTRIPAQALRVPGSG